jgi:ferric-dicitrate binding protein FerR (iron transport regulator)
MTFVSAVRRRCPRRPFRRRGQAALEYILVFAALVAAICAAVHFMRSPRDAARYTTDVICSERF